MARLLILAIVAFLVFAALRYLLAKRNLTVRQFFVVYFSTLVGLALLFLAVTGRLHPVFAVVGAVFPLMMRLIGMIMQGAQVAAMIKGFKSMTGYGQTNAQGPASSEISSRYIQMVLFHDTGKMQGRVLDGQFSGRNLSELDLDQLHLLLKEISADGDSYNLLVAYLDREHEGWQTGDEQEPPPASNGGNMTESEALDILGLDDNANRDAIISAHRRLMQKVHPDRGGSTYLATKLNTAKDLLLGQRGTTQS